MTKMDWNRARKPRADPRPNDTRACANCGKLEERIAITAGALPSGALKVHTFCSRKCAAAKGFPWAGR